MEDLKQALVAAFRELAELALLDEADPSSFRVRAYENAAFDIPAIRGDVSAMSEAELAKNRGIGKSTAKKIREFIETGRIGKLEELRAKYPPAYVALSRLPGLGPKKLAKLHSELGIGSIDDLRAAIAAEKIRGLAGFGKKTEENLARVIERLGASAGTEQRAPIGEALLLAERLVAQLQALPQVEAAHYCGSLRRFRDTIGDVDIVVVSDDPAPIMKAVTEPTLVTDILGSGETKTSIVTTGGLQVDVRVVTRDQVGAALLYFTGSKAHNIRLRQRAIDRGWTLNEYALSDVDSGAIIASKTEEDIYRALELPFIPPPMREDTGEVEAAALGELPVTPTLADIRGDLHGHTTLSGDGRSSLEDMVTAVAARGYAYYAFTEHAENFAMNGVPRAALAERRAAVTAIAKRHRGLHLLHGAELNIGPDGSLDYDPEYRASLDLCVASIHSHFDLDRRRQTERIVRAMHDPTVHIIGHLSGRMIGRRPGVDLDLDAVLAAAAETGTALEINASLARLDATAEVLRQAVALDDILFTISTDAHHTDDLDRMRFGLLQAQRAWVPKDRVLNTWPWRRLSTWLKRKRPRA